MLLLFVKPTATFAPSGSGLSEISVTGETLAVSETEINKVYCILCSLICDFVGLQFSFDFDLSGNEEKCVSVGASSAIQYINASFEFLPPAGNSQSDASDLYVTLQFAGASSCVQLGGLDVEVCTQ